MAIPEKQQKFAELSIKAGSLFKPMTPIGRAELFAGRSRQIKRILDVIFQEGQHAIIYGERGVGKTSLANVFSSFIPRGDEHLSLLSVRINCDVDDSFDTVWRKVIDEMQLINETRSIGYKSEDKIVFYSSDDFFPNDSIRPDDVRRALFRISSSISILPVIVIDEFDRLKSTVRSTFADLLKTLSDHTSSATILLIGVGDSVEHLIQEHQSISRGLAQVQMPRMSVLELREIVQSRLTTLGMEIEESSLNQITLLAKGLPHFAQLIGLHATKDALNNSSTTIKLVNVATAIARSIDDAQHTLKMGYVKATQSARKDNLFSDVLLACALSEADELGGFAAQDVRPQMFKITNKEYDIPAYAQHLKEFTQKKRGQILTVTGEKRLYRYRFSDPLMPPFVLMKGFLSSKIRFD